MRVRLGWIAFGNRSHFLDRFRCPWRPLDPVRFSSKLLSTLDFSPRERRVGGLEVPQCPDVIGFPAPGNVQFVGVADRYVFVVHNYWTLATQVSRDLTVSGHQRQAMTASESRVAASTERSTESTEISMSASVVDQFETEARMAGVPCQ